MVLIIGIVWICMLILKERRQTRYEGFEDAAKPAAAAAATVAVATMMRKPVDVALWLEHHRKIGIRKFYIRLEDSPGTVAFLKDQPDVEFEEGKSGTENNYTLQVDRQVAFVNTILPKALAEGIDWVFHIDVDELLEGDPVQVMGAIPSTFKIAKLKNAEAVYEEEEGTCFSAKRFIRCDKGGPCTAYVNGKGAGRAVEGVRCGGAHDFQYNGKHGDKETCYEIPFEDLHILHYDSCTLGMWMEKFKHMSKKAKLEDIVFPYYRKSLDAATQAADVYKEHKMRDPDSMDKEWTYIRSGGPITF